jgi:hypothetical protein
VGTFVSSTFDEAESFVSILLESPGSGDHPKTGLTSALQSFCFHSFGVPSEWGLKVKVDSKMFVTFHSFGVPSEWGHLSLKPILRRLSRGGLRRGSRFVLTKPDFAPSKMAETLTGRGGEGVD